MEDDIDLKLTAEFRAIDKDNSGSISRIELQNWLFLQNTHEDHIDRIVNDVFGMIDTDGSGTIDQHEFIDCFKRMEHDLNLKNDELKFRVTQLHEGIKESKA